MCRGQAGVAVVFSDLASLPVVCASEDEMQRALCGLLGLEPQLLSHAIRPEA